MEVLKFASTKSTFPVGNKIQLMKFHNWFYSFKYIYIYNVIFNIAFWIKLFAW